MQVFWMLTANSVEGITQRMYAGLLKELNLGGFDPRLEDVVLDRLAGVSPRDLRKILLDGRAHVVAEDIRIKATPGKGRIGF